MPHIASNFAAASRTRRSPARGAAAFTLIELMISIAIVLVLMLGINFVFTTSARTISTGMALTGVSREMRNARRVIEADFRNAVPTEQMPALVIHSEAKFAFMSAADRLADISQTPDNYDVDGDQTNGDEVGASYDRPSFRSHRLDRISFFVSNTTDDYIRQTGDDNTFVGPQKSQEAWVSYGMLRLADNNDLNYHKPGVGNQQSNPNNYYASQWILGRRAILLHTFTGAGTPAQLLGITYGSTSNLNRLPQYPYGSGTPWEVQESRLDIVNTTIATLHGPVGQPPGFFSTGTWYSDADVTTGASDRDVDWFDKNGSGAGPAAGTTLNYLSWAKPFVNKQVDPAWTSAQRTAHETREVALTTPIFLRGCTQFIVEFAGDFYDQAGGGAGLPVPETLGTIDYDVVPGPTPSTRIHWYGRPRDVNGDGNLTPGDDVTTVAGFAASGYAGAPRFPAAGAFEHAPAAGAPGTTPYIWAWGPTDGDGGPTAATVTPPVASAVASNPNYVRPILIRVTIEVMDPNARLAEGQRIEYVFKMPQ